MALSGVFNVLRDAGSKVLDMSQSYPWIHSSLEYVHHNPWTSLAVVTTAYLTYKLINRPRNLPPGPFNWPFIGAKDYMEDMEVKCFRDRHLYGNIVYFRVLGNEIVMLNDENIMKEAYIKRSEDFSERLGGGVFGDVGFPNDGIFTAPFDETYASNKKFAIIALKNFGFGTARSEGKILDAYKKMEAAALENEGCISDPKNTYRKMLVVLIFSIYFNEDMGLDDERTLKFVARITNWFDAFNEGFVFDFVLGRWPLIRKLVSRSAAKKLRVASFDIINEFKGIIKDHRNTVDSSDLRDIIDYFIVNRKDVTDDALATFILLTLPDGVDTVSKISHWTFFYLTYFQDVQRKLQKEIDQAIGPDREVTMGDKAKLPYLDAFILEMLRCSCQASFIPPRGLKKDVQLGGYTIPKTCQVWGSVYGIFFDPEIFPEPHKFNPMRFMTTDGKIDGTMASHIIAFGLGARMCVGQQYVKSQLFLSIGYFVKKYNLKFDSKEPVPELKQPTGSTYLYAPPSHKIVLHPRHV